MSYYRPFSSGYRDRSGLFPPAVKWLIILNVAFYLGPRVLFFNLYTFHQIFGLVPARLFGNLFIWQPVTYMFLHGGTWHILINMFILWMFGSELERTWGTREFLKFYFIAGIGAGLVNVVFSIFSPETWHIPIIGASGAIYGILVAYAMLFPNRLVYVYFLIPVKVKYLVIFLVVIEFLSTYRADGVAHFAHLGGALFGFLYLRYNMRWRLRKWSVSEFVQRLREERVTRKREEGDKLMDEVDAILDKINKVGYENLTRREKKILEKASDKLSDSD
ncbi:MAG: rhomboid family intramembrane serine protease [Candidatus Zixiibacteriota bacterium]|nr:MAG: rhomboid family intramembrane serine protease [candidate division Zixibacteria bacterium]